MKRNKTWDIYRTIGALAAPIVLQSIASSSLGLIDMLMLSKTKDVVIASVGLVNQYLVNINLILAGIGSSCGVFIAQFHGKKDYLNIHRTICLATMTNLIFSLCFVLISFIFSEGVIGFFSKEVTLIEVASVYLKIVLISVIPMCMTGIMVSTLRSLGKTKLPLYAGLVSLVTNTGLNYILIFGKFGVRALGYRGAAYATLISRCLECLLLFLVIVRHRDILAPIGIDPKTFRLKKNFIYRFFMATAHMTINDWLYGFAMTICTVAYASAGVEALSAIEIANNIQNMTFLLIGGVSAAVSIRIGGLVGKGEFKDLEEHGRLYLKFSFFLGIIGGVILLLISPWIKHLFDISDTAKTYVNGLLLIYAVIMCVRFYNYTALSGVFRGAADTRWVMTLELSTVWFIAVPLAFIGAYWLKWPIDLVILLVMIEEVVKAIFVEIRRRSGKWVHRLAFTSEE